MSHSVNTGPESQGKEACVARITFLAKRTSKCKGGEKEIDAKDKREMGTDEKLWKSKYQNFQHFVAVDKFIADATFFFFER